MTLIRRPLKWIALDGATTFIYPTYDLRMQAPRSVRAPVTPLVGADFAVDYLFGGIAPAAAQPVTINFTYVSTATPPTGLSVDTAMDTMLATLFNGGMGKLYTTDDNSVLRWAWCRLMSADIPEDPEKRYHAKVTLQYQRLSHWMVPFNGTQAITTNPQAFTINNPGSLRCYDAIFTFRPTGGSPLWPSPQLYNLTTPVSSPGFLYGFIYDTAAGGALNTTAKQLRVNAGDWTVLRSTDTGATFPTNAYANFIRNGAYQGQFMRLDPGNNSMNCISGPALPARSIGLGMPRGTRTLD